MAVKKVVKKTTKKTVTEITEVDPHITAIAQRAIKSLKWNKTAQNYKNYRFTIAGNDEFDMCDIKSAKRVTVVDPKCVASIDGYNNTTIILKDNVPFNVIPGIQFKFCDDILTANDLVRKNITLSPDYDGEENIGWKGDIPESALTHWSKFSISPDGRLQIGCQIHPLSNWNRIAKRLSANDTAQRVLAVIIPMLTEFIASHTPPASSANKLQPVMTADVIHQMLMDKLAEPIKIKAPRKKAVKKIAKKK